MTVQTQKLQHEMDVLGDEVERGNERSHWPLVPSTPIRFGQEQAHIVDIHPLYHRKISMDYLIKACSSHSPQI
jgi:hypothetical protein